MTVRLPVTALRHRGVLRIRGRDATNFLHAMTTNDAKGAPPYALQYTCFLNHKGRVLFDGIAHPVVGGEEPTYLVEMDRKAVPAAVDHLKEYKLRTKVKIEDVSSEFEVIVDGTEQPDVATGVPDGDLTQPMVTPMRIDPRPPVAEMMHLRRGIVHPSAAPTGAEQIERATAYTELLYSLGVGEGDAAFVSGRSLPFEGNLDLLGGVSFHKGCYVGQELTHRTHVMLVVRKRLLPFELVKQRTPDVGLVGPQLMSNTSLTSAGRILAWSGQYGVGLVRLNNIDPKSKDAVLKVGDGPDAPVVRTWIPPWWPDDMLKHIFEPSAGAAES